MKVSISEILYSVNSLLPKKFQLYVSILVATEGKKTPPRMAEQIDISHDKVYRWLDSEALVYDEMQRIFTKLANLLLKTNNDAGYLVGDDTCLRRFANKMEGAHPMYSSLDERVVTGQGLVVLGWSNGEATIPIAWDFWLAKESCEEGKYRTKIEIMQQLIEQIRYLIKFNYVLLDGLYESEAMMNHLDNLNVKFLMRLPKNRTIRQTEDSPACKIGESKAYKLKGNQRSKASVGFINGKKRHVAIEKRKNRAGNYETVYLISNFQREAREYISIYQRRWNIEQLFRTAKQSLGLGDCQSTYLKKQNAHIFSVFIAFAIADSIKYIKKMPSTGDGIRYLKSLISDIQTPQKWSSGQVFYATA